MRSRCSVFLLMFACVWGIAQNSSNPFELTPRLAPEYQDSTFSGAQEETRTNPFDITPSITDAPANAAVAPPNTSQNPFDIIPVEEDITTEPFPPEEEHRINSNDGEAEARSTPTGVRLAIALLTLVFTAFCLLFFRGIYTKCYRALFNDNLLSQLYRERESGALGSFLITYLVFFLGGGFFVALIAMHFAFLPSKTLWQLTVYGVLGLAAVLIFKHFVLALLGYIFPLAKETSRYSFTIMVFSIIAGLILSLGSLLLAYAPTGAEPIIIWGSLGVLVLLYILRSLRGFFIANQFLIHNQFHFLSYICAVEIGPALCFFKLLTNF